MDLTTWILNKINLDRVNSMEKNIVDMNSVKNSIKGDVDYLKSSALPRKSLDTVDYKVFRALITNPLKGISNVSNSYDNPLVQVKISFSMGECKNEKCLEVISDSGSALPFQWDGEKDPNFIKNRKRSIYPDGSLKHGTIWVKLSQSIADATQVYLTIRVWDNDIDLTQPDTVTVTASKTAPEDTLSNYVISAGGVEITSKWRDGYYPSLVTIGGSTSSTKLFDPKVKDNTYTDINNYQNIDIVSCDILGTGAVFRELVVDASYKYNSAIKAKFYLRVFSDGSFTLEHYFYTTTDLASGILNGIDIRAKYDGTPSVFMENAVHNGTLISMLKNLQILPGTNDTNDYVSKELFNMDTVNKMVRAGWQLASGTAFSIPAKSFWSARYIFKPKGASTNLELQAEGLKMMNPIVTRATSANSMVDKGATLDLLREFVLTQHPLIGRNGWNLFKGCNVISKIAYQKITGTVNPIEIYNDTKAFLDEFYSGGTTKGFWDSWSGKDGTTTTRGLEFIGRDTVCLPFVRELLLEYGEQTKANEITQVIHNVADFYLQVELDSGKGSAEGYVALTYSKTRTIKMMVPNAATALLRDVKASINIASNTARLQSFERVKAKFFAVNTFYNYSPHVEGTSNVTHSEIHYEYFSGYDYANSVSAKLYIPAQRVLEMVNSSGSVNELRSNYANHRRGLVHTLFYAIGILLERGQLGDYSHAYYIAQNVLNKCYPDGYHEQPLDLYINNDPKSASAPIEVAVAAEILLHHT